MVLVLVSGVGVCVFLGVGVGVWCWEHVFGAGGVRSALRGPAGWRAGTRRCLRPRPLEGETGVVLRIALLVSRAGVGVRSTDDADRLRHPLGGSERADKTMTLPRRGVAGRADPGKAWLCAI